MAGFLAVVGVSADAAALTEAEKREICAEAAGRYRQMTGKAPAEEPFVAILMYRDIFCPESLVVKQGTRLRWINVDRRTSHSVWLREAGRAESERVFPEEVVDMVVDLPPGQYPYICGPHVADGMTGKLTVTEK